MVASLRGGARSSSAPVILGDPNFPRDASLGVVAYGFWGPVLQAPAQGPPTIVGGLPPTLLQGQIPPSPRRGNACPSLPMIPISLLLCVCLRGDGAGSAAASTPSPVPFPVIPSGVIRSFCRDSIVLLSSSLLRSKSQRFVPRTTNCPPPIKNWLCQFLHMPHSNKRTKPIFWLGGTVGGTRYEALIF